MKALPLILVLLAATETVVVVPTQDQVLACEADARRLCGPYLASPIGVIRACVETHILRASEKCQKALK